VRERGQELQQQQRRVVRPVQIVEHQHQRLGAAGVLQELGDAVEETEAHLIRLERRRRRQTGETLAHVGDHLGDVGRARSHLGAQRLRVALVYVGAHDLHPGPVGGCPGALVTASPENLRAAQPRVGAELLRRARLADAGLAHQHQHPPSTREALVDPVAGLVDLTRAADEVAAREAVERVQLLVIALLRGVRRGRRDLVECGARVGRARGALLGILGEQLQHQRLEGLRHGAVVPAGRDRRRVDVL
jgi:hypothetical protein